MGTGSLAGADRCRTRRQPASRAGQRKRHRRLHHPGRQRRLPLRHRQQPVAGLRQGREPDQPDRALRQLDPARHRPGPGAQHRGRLAHYLLSLPHNRSLRAAIFLSPFPQNLIPTAFRSPQPVPPGHDRAKCAALSFQGCVPVMTA
ncbi:hypothetical protein EMIT0162MI3_20759 [Pseudomonas chlororaphis]